MCFETFKRKKDQQMPFIGFALFIFFMGFALHMALIHKSTQW